MENTQLERDTFRYAKKVTLSEFDGKTVDVFKNETVIPSTKLSNTEPLIVIFDNGKLISKQKK